MPPPHHSRRDLADLKSQIARKLGPERAQCYFGYLNRLLAQKLSKSEFDKLCFRTLGPENIALHNQFIRLILRNACQAKVPPPAVHERYSLKTGKAVGKKSPSADDWFHSSATSVLSNGEILSPSPCKSRSTNYGIKDHSSPLGANGKIDSVAHQLRMPSDEVTIGGKCDLITCGLKTPVQHQQGGIAVLPPKKQRVDGEEPVQTDCAQSNSRPICAPLGIPFCPVSIGGAHRPAPVPTCTNNDGFASNCYSGELCHTEALRRRMEKTAVAQDLGGVTMECANILNNGLDAYLKRLIKSCVELVGARSGHEPIKQPLIMQQSRAKFSNGIWQGNHMHVQRCIGPLEGTQEPRNHHRVSLLDFRVAMELNPQQVGECWPLLVEKVCIHSFEE